MSPSNINSFVGDLVQMATAFENLPKIEAELEQTKSLLNDALQSVQDRELSIVRYKQDIDDLNAKVRSLEVERDDASFRVLEAEDREHVVLDMARSIASAVGNVISTLDPPKPQPEPTPVTEPVYTSTGFEPQAQPVATPVEAPTLQGQSESSPTVQEAQSAIAQTTTTGVETAASADPAPTHGPYFGKRYYDHPVYVTLSEWLNGGGTEADYNWRPIVERNLQY